MVMYFILTTINVWMIMNAKKILVREEVALIPQAATDAAAQMDISSIFSIIFVYRYDW